jgi:O-antigen ligase
MYNFTLGVTQGDGRFTGPGFDPNDLAVTLSLGIPIAWYLAFTSRRTIWANRLYIPCALAAVLLTASRSGLLTLAVSMVFPLISVRQLSKRGRWAVTLVCVLCVGSILYVIGDVSVQRLSTTIEQLTGGDMNGRVDIWRQGLEVFWRNPVLGAGGGSFGTAVVGKSGAHVAAHNTFLGVLVEHGIVGLLLFVLIIGSIVRRIWGGSPLERRFWIVMLLAWGVALSSLSWENRELTWLLWGLCTLHPWRRSGRTRWTGAHQCLD